jgi:tetratricopeptide (TPR) repeat protein
MIEFLGRTVELAALERSIADWGRTHVVALAGPGGIGKTRLLREVARACGDAPRTRVLDVIDFDLPIYEIPQIVGRAIARQFEPQVFAPYLESLRLRQIAEEGGVDPLRLEPQALDANRHFIECCNRAAAVERLVLRFDTAEKMQRRLQLQALLGLILGLKNVVAIFAGRPHAADQGEGLDALYHELERRNDSHIALSYVQLEPFDLPTFQEYVERKKIDAGLELDDTWRETLALLAGGRPIRIDLAIELGNQIEAAEWLRQMKSDLPRLTELQHSPIAKDRVEFAAIQQRFDLALVADVINIRSDLDRLKVLLAMIAPLSRTQVATILQMSPEAADATFEAASRSVAFKVVDGSLITLHDAVCELLSLYIIPELDPERERERIYLERALACVEQETASLLEQIHQVRAEEDGARARGDHERSFTLFESRTALQRAYQHASMRIVEFVFRLDPITGARRLDHELRIARQHGIFLPDLYALFDTVQPYIFDLQRRSMSDYIYLQTLLADQYVQDGQYAQAEAIYNIIEPRLTQRTPQRFRVLDRYGDIQMGVGKAQAALEHYRQAADLARHLCDDALLAQALLSCGWAWRVLGQLDGAIRSYQQALALTLKDTVGEEALIQRARALNGLAYVYAIQGKRRTAVDSLQQAIEIRRSLGDSGRFALAQSYATAGEIYIDLEQPQQALKYISLAEDLFAELGSRSRASGGRSPRQYSQWFAKIAAARGRAHWALSAEATDRHERADLLWRAEEELRSAVKVAIAADLPSARYRLANVISADPARHALAVETWQRSYLDARDFGDIFFELNSVSQLARMAIYGQNVGYTGYADFDAWLVRYHERNPGAYFSIVEACFAIYRGGLALQAGDVGAAYERLRQGLGVLVEQPRQSTYSFDWQVRFIQNDLLPTCDPQVVREVWRRVLNDWTEQGKGVEAWMTFERWRHWQE